MEKGFIMECSDKKSVFLPGQIYLHNDAWKNVLIFYVEKVIKISKMTLSNYY